MRQIVLDTETTGLEWKAGHRVIEIACVEMVNRQLTGRHFHHYLNPDRDIDPGAQEVHGITLEFLQDKPRFKDVVDEFLDYVKGAELVIHNAPFDVGFLNNELGLLGRDPIEACCAGVVDTLRLAKELHPGKRNNLDVLCERYAVDNSNRTLHGALLDSELLAEVYLAMTRGQESLMMDLTAAPAGGGGVAVRREGLNLLVRRADEAELAAHQALLDELDKTSDGKCVWKQLDAAPLA